MATTMVDVAKLAGVSRSTVSRVLNDHPNVTPEVRERVQKVICQTGYRPHAAARSLRSQSSDIIALVVPRDISTIFSDYFFPLFIGGIAQACREFNFTLSLFMEYDERSLLSRITKPGLLAGLVVQSGEIRSTFHEALCGSRMPFVVSGRPDPADGINYVDIDNVTAAYNAVVHLSRLGRRRIGTITGPLNFTVGIDRLHGYKDGMAERGLSFDNLVVEGDFTEESGYHAAKHLLERQPDAIFAACDMMAYGALRAVLEAGMHVPDDIALVGFDDVPIRGTDPAFLTTVRQPIRQSGYKAVEILKDIIDYNPEPPRRIVLPTELVIRVSCGGGGSGSKAARGQ